MKLNEKKTLDWNLAHVTCKARIYQKNQDFIITPS